MDITRLNEILSACTSRFRKARSRRDTRSLGIHVHPGPAHLRGEGEASLALEALPPESEARDELLKIDFEMFVVGIDRLLAERHRAELLELLSTYPRPDRLRAGLSYVEAAADIGDRGRALELFALGKALALWDLITPARLRLQGESARRLAELGIIMTTGFAAAQAPRQPAVECPMQSSKTPTIRRTG